MRRSTTSLHTKRAEDEAHIAPKGAFVSTKKLQEWMNVIGNIAYGEANTFQSQPVRAGSQSYGNRMTSASSTESVQSSGNIWARNQKRFNQTERRILGPSIPFGRFERESALDMGLGKRKRFEPESVEQHSRHEHLDKRVKTSESVRYSSNAGSKVDERVEDEYAYDSSEWSLPESEDEKEGKYVY